MAILDITRTFQHITRHWYPAGSSRLSDAASFDFVDMARELHLSRNQMYTFRQRVQANLNDTAPSDLIDGTTFEADEIYQNAGEKSTPISIQTIRHDDTQISRVHAAPMTMIDHLSSIWSHTRNGLLSLPDADPRQPARRADRSHAR